MAFKHRYLGPLLWGRQDNDINCMYFCILFLLISEDSTAYLWMRGTRSIFNIFSKFQRDNAQSRLNFIKSISLFWFEDLFAKRASTPYPINSIEFHHNSQKYDLWTLYLARFWPFSFIFSPVSGFFITFRHFLTYFWPESGEASVVLMNQV